MQHQLVTILSTNYAGSHLLSLILGSHSNVACIGEVHRLKELKKDNGNEVCSVCSSQLCPIFSNIEIGEDVSNIYNKVFNNFQAYDPNIKVLIDNSKKVRWAKRFLKSPIKRKYILLIRDPRALIRRWKNDYDDTQKLRKVRKVMFGRSLRTVRNLVFCNAEMLFVNKWLYQNELKRKFLEKNNLDYRIVTYHDLINHQSGVISELIRWMDLTFEPKQLNYWEFKHHSTMKPNYRTEKTAKSYFDLRWQDDLAPELIEQIAKSTQVNSFLSKMHLRLEKDGITQVKEIR